MPEIGISAFGGIAGRVYRHSLSWSTLGTGLMLGAAGALLAWLLSLVDAGGIFSFALHISFALVLIRFAVNGLSGEWGGSLFSSAGGPWTLVGLVAFRYLSLQAVWLVPLALAGVEPGESGALVGSLLMGGGERAAMLLLLVHTTLTALTPPLFLIVALSADRYSGIFSPTVWRAAFAGRGHDLLVIYALYLGGVTAVCLLLLPVTGAGFLLGKELGILVGVLGLGFVAGLVPDLLGRLCGFYAAFEPHVNSEPGAVSTDPASPEFGIVSEPDLAGNASAMTGAAAGDAGTTPGTAPHLQVVGETLPRTPSGKPPLLDARNRVDTAAQIFEHDAEGCLVALEQLRESYAEHPLVLHALALHQRKAGRVDDSFRTATEALPLCLARGNLRLAAELFQAQIDRAPDLELPGPDLIRIGSQLGEMHRVAPAARAFAMVIEENAWETGAIKGMLQLAELEMSHGAAAEAAKIYRFLLDNCSESPLVDFMRQGLDEAERRATGT